MSLESDLALRDVSRARRKLDWLNLLLWAVVLGFGAKLAWEAARNPAFEWAVVGQWFFDPSILRGLSVTLGLTVVSMVIGVAVGVLLAVARMSGSRLFRGLAWGYIWFFRGTPLLVQLIFWYNMSTLFSSVSLGVPFGPAWMSRAWVTWKTNDLITPLTAAFAGLALNEAAYMAEIVRGGLLSIDPGQMETARAFGMTHGRALRRIVIPQAMRAIIPPTGNQLISMIKATSLVSVIAMADLLYSAQAVYNRTFEVIPLLLVAVIWYLLVTSVLNVGQGFIERRFARGDRNTAVADPV